MGARLFYIGLWNFADDAGVFEWHGRLLKSQVFPFDEGIDIAAVLGELEKCGRIEKFTHNGREYGLIVNFPKYQKPDSRYLKYLIGNYEHVKSISHGGETTGSRGEPPTDSDGEGVIDGEVTRAREGLDEKAEESETNDEADPGDPGASQEILFREVVLREEWCDEHYADKVIKQSHELGGKHRKEFYRKVRVMLNSAQHPRTLGFARKVYGEIAGLVNDHGPMERVLSGEELADRRRLVDEGGI